MFDEKLKQWITQNQKNYDEMLIQVMNKHGIPITRENAKDFIGKINMWEYDEPAICGHIVVIFYEGKEIARLKKWLEFKDSIDLHTITQHIEEIPTEDTKLELKGLNADQVFIDENI